MSELQIATIWSETLGVAALDIEPDADFLKLGGDSLAAVRMLLVVEERLGARVDIGEFLEEPTLCALADAVAGAADAPPPAVDLAAERDCPARLSHAQERLWFLEQLGGSTDTYNMPIGVRLRGAIDIAALTRALKDVVARHEALRTTFSTKDGRPVAVVSPLGEAQLEQTDLRADADPERGARQIVTALASRPFDLGRGPLMRAALLRVDEHEHLLELVFHHIVCDGLSQAIVMRELGELYEAHRAGRPPALVEPRVQYGDFVRAQRAVIGARETDTLVGPWLQRLEGAPHALELPTDRPRPAVPSGAGATYRVRLDHATVAAVRELAKAEKATPFATLLSAFYVLLYRHSGQDDIVIGATTAARHRPELEDGVGLFASTVALRGDLSGAPSFKETLARVSETVLWAIAHDQTPLQEIVARLPLERDLSRHPLFQVFCAQVPLVTLPIEGAEPYDAYPTTSRFDLTLFIEEKAGDELELAWEYSSDLFDAATIKRLAARYLRLLQAVLADPRLRVDELPLLDGAEREQALAAGRERRRDYPVQCMHQAFERCAAAAPDAVALSFEGSSLTYGELNARANRLAHRLIEMGVGPETIVALFLEPSPELVVAVLGILKAGGAYLPLDPEHPRERIDFMLEDAGSDTIVSEARLLELLDARAAAKTVCLDRDAAELRGLSVENPVSGVVAENLAYVIYTSGSTGRPKGVRVEHRQVARLFSATEEWFRFGPQDVWILLHSYAFDFSVWEFWGALAHGGELLISPLWTTRSPDALAKLIARRGVTVLNATPSLFVAVQEELLARAEQLSLRHVIFGGEALRPPALRPWFEHYGDSGPELVNMYGITETTVHVTYRPLRAADCERDASPVGVPIPDLSVYVLDKKRTPLPAGVAGELYVGGAGVARDYLNRPELTAERFIENPFGEGRLYRTGDVAARLDGGELDFRGRADDQVKIRGFRIELGEIESALREHSAVADCTVVAIETAGGDDRLVAYVVADAATATAANRANGARPVTPPHGALREQLLGHIGRRLPSYMVPAALVFLDRIPLTRNGKADRRALPAPSWEQEATAEVSAPVTPTERLVAEVWSEVLGVEQVGAEDNFFNLGGHSLLAARVTTEMRKRCRVEISVRALFEQPTLREFAAALDTAGTSAAADHTEADGGAEPAGRPACGSYPLSFPQQQLLFFDQLSPGSVTYNAALAWRVRGPLDVQALRHALGQVYKRHEALRTVFVWGEEATPAQVVCGEWNLELPVLEIDAGEQREQELARLLREHSLRPYDLSCDPMLRTTVFQLGEQEHVILFAPHHIAFDAWAVEVLYSELGELYAARWQQREPQLPSLSLQYRDFAAWQRERLRGELLHRELDFWRSQLAGAPTVARLPADRARPVESSFEGATHNFVLDGDLARAVRELCSSAGVTPYMLLLAAFSTLLYRTSGQDDILFGGPMANRQMAGIEPLIGFFANTVVVRTQLGGNPTFGELLGRVRDSVLASYEHQETPLELVVDAVRPERQAGVHPLFQVNFRVRVGDSAVLRLDGAHAEPVAVDLNLARFELSLELHLLEDRIEGELIYDVAMFDRSTAERLASDLRAVLNTFLFQPEARLLSFQLPSEETPREGTGSARAGIQSFRRTAAGAGG